jgi:hypothetical protein
MGFSQGVKRLGREADHSSPSRVEVKSGGLYLQSTMRVNGEVLNYLSAETLYFFALPFTYIMMPGSRMGDVSCSLFLHGYTPSSSGCYPPPLPSVPLQSSNRFIWKNVGSDNRMITFAVTISLGELTCIRKGWRGMQQKAEMGNSDSPHSHHTSGFTEIVQKTTVLISTQLSTHVVLLTVLLHAYVFTFVKVLPVCKTTFWNSGPSVSYKGS